MNNIANINNTGNLKAGVAADSLGTNVVVAGKNGIGENNARPHEDPFRQLIQNAHDVSAQQKEGKEVVLNGKNMPVADDATAQTDRSSISSSPKVAGELSTDIVASTQNIKLQSHFSVSELTVDHSASASEKIEVSAYGEDKLLATTLVETEQGLTNNPPEVKAIVKPSLPSELSVDTGDGLNIVLPPVTLGPTPTNVPANFQARVEQAVENNEMPLLNSFNALNPVAAQNNALQQGISVQAQLPPLTVNTGNAEVSEADVSLPQAGASLAMSSKAAPMPSPDISALSDQEAILSKEGVVVTDKVMAANKKPVNSTNIQAQLPPVETNIENKIVRDVNQLTSSLSTNDNSRTGSEWSAVSPQLRTLLNVESSANGKRVQVNPVRATDGSMTINSSVESIATQSSDFVRLNTQVFELMSDKNSTLTTPPGQQQILSNVQSTLLQTNAAPVNAHIESSTLITNITVNNVSTANISSIYQAEIPEAFGRQAWPQGMGKQILMMVNQNIGSAEIRLNPAHLGPIEILIDMSEDQVNVSLSSRHAVVREAMEQALPKLREMLDENGFNLADTDISKESFAQQREQDTDSKNRDVLLNSNNPTLSSEISEQIIQNVQVPDGKVDYYI